MAAVREVQVRCFAEKPRAHSLADPCSAPEILENQSSQHVNLSKLRVEMKFIESWASVWEVVTLGLAEWCHDHCRSKYMPGHRITISERLRMNLNGVCQDSL